MMGGESSPVILPHESPLHFMGATIFASSEMKARAQPEAGFYGRTSYELSLP